MYKCQLNETVKMLLFEENITERLKLNRTTAKHFPRQLPADFKISFSFSSFSFVSRIHAYISIQKEVPEHVAERGPPDRKYTFVLIYNLKQQCSNH